MKYTDGWHMELENCSSHSPQSTNSGMEMKLPQLCKLEYEKWKRAEISGSEKIIGNLKREDLEIQR
jgi:hypothetical protein